MPASAAPDLHSAVQTASTLNAVSKPDSLRDPAFQAYLILRTAFGRPGPLRPRQILQLDNPLAQVPVGNSSST